MAERKRGKSVPKKAARKKTAPKKAAPKGKPSPAKKEPPVKAPKVSNVSLFEAKDRKERRMKDFFAAKDSEKEKRT